MHDWNYHDEDPVRGPSKWAHQFPQAGKAQSPIDIQIDYCDLQQHQQQVNCSCTVSSKLKRLNLRPSSNDASNNQLAAAAARRHLNSTGGELFDDDEFDLDERPSSTGSNFSNSNASSAGSPPALKQDCQSIDKRLEHSNNIKKLQQQQQQQQQPEAKITARQRDNTQQTRYCAANKKLFLGYPRYLNTVKLCNTGHAWQIDLPPELTSHTLLSGPPLGDREYRLRQLHCHWGSQCDQGSEHLVNGRSYSAEMHFVHWNCKEFRTFEEAARHKHGLAVLAVFVQALDGDEQNCNKHLERIVAALPRVNERPHAEVELVDLRLDLKKLFPTNRWLYASYEGSLTTPPLSEVVDWIVFLQPIQCSRRQIEAFRRLKCNSSGERLEKNCRPVQPVNQRVVSIWTHGG